MFKNFFKKMLVTKNEKDRINEYLSDSSDLTDLENRIRRIDRGQAPWQLQAAQLMKGWS